MTIPPSDISGDVGGDIPDNFDALIKESTINDVTLLSTDYLNHYNELVMMIEMVPDMPDLFEEVQAWEPKSYIQHFRDSGFQYKDLAIWAFDNAPERFREPLNDCIERADRTVHGALPMIAQFVQDGSPEALEVAVATLITSMRRNIDMMSALINGAMDAERYYEQINSEAAAGHDQTVMDQNGIDALFE